MIILNTRYAFNSTNIFMKVVYIMKEREEVKGS